VDSSRFHGTLFDPNDFTCSVIDGRRFFSSDGLVGLGASTRGDAISMTIGYPDPGGLCGNGSARSCDGAGGIAIGIGFVWLGDRGAARFLCVDGPADDCSEKDVVRVELEPVRLTLLGAGIATLGGGS